MPKVNFDLSEMRPWADINSILSRATSLKVVCGGEVYEDKATLEMDGARKVTLTVHAKPAKLKARPQARAYPR